MTRILLEDAEKGVTGRPQNSYSISFLPQCCARSYISLKWVQICSGAIRSQVMQEYSGTLENRADCIYKRNCSICLAKFDRSFFRVIQPICHRQLR